jgi:hypothetical protein
MRSGKQQGGGVCEQVCVTEEVYGVWGVRSCCEWIIASPLSQIIEIIVQKIGAEINICHNKAKEWLFFSKNLPQKAKIVGWKSKLFALTFLEKNNHSNRQRATSSIINRNNRLQNSLIVNLLIKTQRPVQFLSTYKLQLQLIPIIHKHEDICDSTLENCVH